jgi:hypothetical protein
MSSRYHIKAHTVAPLRNTLAFFTIQRRNIRNAVAFLLLITSCSPLNLHYITDSRDQALYCGKMMAGQHETKIMFTPAIIPSQWNAQAKTKIDEEWKWLEMDKEGKCYTGSQTQFNLLNEFSVSDFEHFLNLWDSLPPEFRLPSAWIF